MLANTIALLTLAVMLASEGKRTEGGWRTGLYTLATIVALVALALKPIADRLPSVGTALTNIFGSPLAWFVLAMGLYFALRPFWAKQPSAKGATRTQRLKNLQGRGWFLTERIRHHRNLQWFERDRAENLLDITRDGFSILLDYEKEGLPVPHFNNIVSAEKCCVGMEVYFSSLGPFMRDGHVAQVDAMAQSVAERALATAAAFNPEKWSIDKYGL